MNAINLENGMCFKFTFSAKNGFNWGGSVYTVLENHRSIFKNVYGFRFERLQKQKNLSAEGENFENYKRKF